MKIELIVGENNVRQGFAIALNLRRGFLRIRLGLQNSRMETAQKK